VGEVAEKLDRMASTDLDAILGRKFAVLDDGFIRVVDYMGTDASIVQAARVSYGKGTKKVNEDRGLIRYLMRHRHTTPMEMCELKLHVRVPMDHWRQWIRHRMASVNEYSTRYSEAIDSAARTPASKWRLQSGRNKQGSSGYLPDAEGAILTAAEESLHAALREAYQKRLDSGVAREQARKDLTLSTYTEAYWKIDLHNLLHFLSLRMDAHAQEEIRAYATVIGEEIVKRWVPISWEAFLDYRLHAMTLSRLDIHIIRGMAISRQEAISTATMYGWLELDAIGRYKPNRERDEFEVKADRLGLSVPWLGILDGIS
jgi:thymidylate synthase (FAD)